MNPNKKKYIADIRANTAYPTYRSIIGLITVLGYILAGLYALGALIGGLTSMSQSFFAGLGIIVVGGVAAAIIFLGAKFLKEAALILADIGDSITDTNARNED